VAPVGHCPRGRRCPRITAGVLGMDRSSLCPPDTRRSQPGRGELTSLGEVYMHKFRISFITGLVTGYVLGARAGRERYEQMKKVARTVADNPAVQQAAGAAQAQAAGLAATAGTKIADGVRDRVPQIAHSSRAGA